MLTYRTAADDFFHTVISFLFSINIILKIIKVNIKINIFNIELNNINIKWGIKVKLLSPAENGFLFMRRFAVHS